MQLFSADAIVFSKKSKKKICPRKHEKTALKVAHKLAAQTARKQKSCTTTSPLMQDWVFRLVISTYETDI